ncbi:hypothetical protein LTR24_005607 [Lithohypha guttulata]|uniref:Uncharacterized protein n=1 Tax=Lithohypha guttulata TaxID=1690604 RepID=A0ABR0K8X1_9EURO|nr:hypothetical protein LTR24_005607 [Lithohypha guttulata]
MSLNSLSSISNRSSAGSEMSRSSPHSSGTHTPNEPSEPPISLSYIEDLLDPGLHDIKTRLDDIDTRLLGLRSQSALPNPPIINGNENVNDYFEWQCKLKAKLVTLEHLDMSTKMHLLASRATGAAFHLIQNDLPRPTAVPTRDTDQNVDVLFAKLDKWFYDPENRRLPAPLRRPGQGSGFVLYRQDLGATGIESD